ncbi:MAG: hypothetical protein Q4Q62_05345 [Thermoplasmata archaeon]|nr:hypothetical protein [Thermoplasmata archaeon]
MTATYDGKLIVSKDGIEACCRMMDKALFSGVVYKGTINKAPALAIKVGDKGARCVCCPFCGAQAVMQ